MADSLDPAAGCFEASSASESRRSSGAARIEQCQTGSGISLGHPLGATGGRYALVTMCIGGGQGIAAVFERI